MSIEPSPVPEYLSYPSQDERIVLGLISGTSADGVDVAAVRIRGGGPEQTFQVLSFNTVPYPNQIRARVLEAFADRLSLRQTALLNTELGEFFGQVALDAIPDEGCHLIASHGQTVCHLPESRTTLQLGEGAVIANRTKVLTMSDFRTADMALGGQGAPLVPLFDAYLLQSKTRSRIAINLGGIANLTMLSPGSTEIWAWDTGPANCVSDALCRFHDQGHYDPNGEKAASGVVQDELLEKLLQWPYFRAPYPKSTGLEDFGMDFAVEHFQGHSLPDLLRTALALSAQTLVDGLAEGRALLPEGPIDLVFAGGGTANKTLMAEIEQRLKTKIYSEGLELPAILSFQDFGVSEDAREAAAFAFLGDRTMRGLVGSVPSTTGASHAAILGKLSFPSLRV